MTKEIISKNTPITIQLGGLIVLISSAIWFNNLIGGLQRDVKGSEEDTKESLQQIQKTLDKVVDIQWTVKMQKYTWDEVELLNGGVAPNEFFLKKPDIKKIHELLSN